ncbi:APC family permease [Pseudonocardia sp. HH130630-07]|uniref:APC family permease n=1 Tax=Pseudonocardia sp. HH130630-07 TaxID=1690815 RepID=UPI000814C6C0|nr:APC family permease [Pseudonocardia sp. HH130630-07]ANY10463.1 amino acid permease [Pseudonocardia sp. HH130630-07]
MGRSRDATAAAPGRLKAGAVGVPGMVFMVVAAAAPLTALSSNISLGLGMGVGAAAVLVMIGTGLLLAIFSAGYLVLARYVTCAGAYQAFVAFGLGRGAGGAVAFVATLAYTLAAGGMVAASGYFTGLAVAAVTGTDLPWWLYGAGALLVTVALGIRGVEVAQRLTTAVSLLQFGIVVVLAVAVLAARPVSAWTDERLLSPAAALGPGLAVTLVFCLLSFAGFEAAAAYGEETDAPARSITLATYAALGLLLAVFVLGTWTLVAAFDDVRAVAAADPGAVVLSAADRFLGPWSGPLLGVLVAISFLAAAVAFANLAIRYLFTLGRGGLLPRALARTHGRYQTPYVGCVVVAAVAVVVLVPFALTGADPLVTLFPAVSGITSISLVAMMTGCCASVVTARARGAVRGSAWSTVVAPVLAGAGLVAVLVLIVVNYAEVTGSTSPVIGAMPLVVLVAAVTGAAATRLRPDGGRGRG